MIDRTKENEKKLVMMIDFSVSHMSQFLSSLHQSVKEETNKQHTFENQMKYLKLPHKLILWKVLKIEIFTLK